MAAFPEISGNSVNGFGQSEYRQASPFFWHPPELQPHGGLQAKVLEYLFSQEEVALEFSHVAMGGTVRGPEPVAQSDQRVQRTPQEWSADIKQYGLANEADVVGIAAMRDAYFEVLGAAFSEPPNGVVIDKMPIRTVYAGVLWRLIPDARFIFCLRHPCDVVLSNFMQHYTVSDAFANFLTLEGSVKIYDGTMRLWQTYLDKLPLNVHTVRYEQLVEDLEQSVREVLSFLDLPWDPAVLEYAERARQRGRINTNSYHQVTEEIYTRSRDRWRAYGKFLEPHLAVLRPHLEYFGYDD